MDDTGLVQGADGETRCWWCSEDAEYMLYHDTEWGKPMHDDQKLFEKVCLEGFQAGLSWKTILHRREAFRRAFANFEYKKLAKWGDGHVEKLLTDARIIRHRGKIESVINNAKRAVELVKEFGSLDAYFWRHAPKEKKQKMTKDVVCQRSKGIAGTELAKDLKKRGWTFVGPTTMYAFMQSVGLVNDHLDGCSFK